MDPAALFDVSAWDLAALSRAWRAAAPFAHVVLDDLVAPGAFAGLRREIAQEPHFPSADEIHCFLGSAPSLTRPGLRAFGEALGAATALEAIRSVTGKQVARVDVRSYAYLEGHYLLPHTDHRREVGRAVAFAYYLTGGDALEGGELGFFECETEAGEIVATRAAAQVTPRENRLVLFDVSDVSLHEVREVTRGARLSLAGWFYP